MALCASLDLPTLADVVDYHPATASPEAPLTTVLPLLAQAESLCPLTCAVSARSRWRYLSLTSSRERLTVLL
ncbi:MAG: hypothetical protein HC839_06575 [Leptolyngbyaceae cyanobacterium RM2_2_21]|nr:hypothetical protein [Leptolyngbyaceae cyanobacterium RM2_2_21]